MILFLGFIGDLIDDKINLEVFDKLNWFLLGVFVRFCIFLGDDGVVEIGWLIFVIEVLGGDILGGGKIFEIIVFSL